MKNMISATFRPGQETLFRALPRDRLRARTHLEELEAESIHIIREAVGESEKPGDTETCNTAAIGMIEAMQAGENSHYPRRKATLKNLIRSTETHGRSVAKAISWRMTGSLDTFLVAIVITGSSRMVGGVALAEILTKTLFYYLHERIWTLITWGRR